MKTEKPLPCPFCGVEPKIITNGQYTRIRCGNQGCNMFVTGFENVHKKAIQFWNTRTPVVIFERETEPATIPRNHLPGKFIPSRE